MKGDANKPIRIGDPFMQGQRAFQPTREQIELYREQVRYIERMRKRQEMAAHLANETALDLAFILSHVEQIAAFIESLKAIER